MISRGRDKILSYILRSLLIFVPKASLKMFFKKFELGTVFLLPERLKIAAEEGFLKSQNIDTNKI